MLQLLHFLISCHFTKKKFKFPAQIPYKNGGKQLEIQISRSKFIKQW